MIQCTADPSNMTFEVPNLYIYVVPIEERTKEASVEIK